MTLLPDAKDEELPSLFAPRPRRLFETDEVTEMVGVYCL